MGSQVKCPQCGHQIAVKQESLGKQVTCSNCETVVALGTSTTQREDPAPKRQTAVEAKKGGTLSPSTGNPIGEAEKSKPSTSNPQSSEPKSDTANERHSDTFSPDQTSSRVGGLSGQFGRYNIISKLGEGGMGAVYLAEDPELDRKVAIKIPFLKKNKAGALARFRHEAKAIAALQHANICPVFEVSSVYGVHYMAMAFIEGKPMSDMIRADKPLPIRGVIKMVRVLALALDRAHRAGVIHRDLKPDNVVINNHQEPIIMDFGLARREGSGDTKLTRAGQLMGTPAYMSPEQVSGNVDAMGPGCDIYSLGVILYEMLTGKLPFDGDLLSVLSSVANERPKPPSRLRSEIAPALDEICLKAMEKGVEDRFASMAEFAQALSTHYAATYSSPSVPEKKRTVVEPTEAGPNKISRVTAFEQPDVVAKDSPDESKKTSVEHSEPSEAHSVAPVPHAISRPEKSSRRWGALAAAGLVLVVAVLGLASMLRPKTPVAQSPPTQPETPPALPGLAPNRSSLATNPADRSRDQNVNANASVREADPVEPAPSARVAPSAVDMTPTPPPPEITEDKLAPLAVAESVGMTFRLVRAGEFFIGSPDSEKPRRSDETLRPWTLTKSFYLGEHEVTNEQFEKFQIARFGNQAIDRGTSANYDDIGGEGINQAGARELTFRYNWKSLGESLPWEPQNPVVNITSADAEAFCVWLTEKEGVIHRLPTEQEWEVACRAGTKTKFYNGDDDRQLFKIANVADQSFGKLPGNSATVPGNDGTGRLAAVGGRQPNELGLFDMLGNVAEWCSGDAKGLVTYRGGSWASGIEDTRAAARRSVQPPARYVDVGFRVLREVEQSTNAERF